MHFLKITKKKAKFIAAFLCVCLVMGLSMNQAGLLQFTRADDAVWSGEYPSATKALKGQGTATSPFLIDTAADFAQFSYNVNNGMYSGTQYFELRSDINLANGEWVPIGDNTGHDFTGVFNGGGHKITGLKITIGATRTEFLGVFGRTMNAQIKNVSLGQCAISQSNAQNGSFIGGLIGVAESTSVSNCSLINSSIVGNASVGGLIGQTTGSSDITDCYVFNSKVTTTLKSVGGIAGSSKGGTFVNCYTRGNSVIENTATGDVDPSEQTAGGILGYSIGSVNIVNCYNNSSVKSTNIAGGIANGTSFAIRNCYNVGAVEASTGQCGSLFGNSNTSNSVVERSFYLKTASEKPYPDGATVTASNVGYFANAQSSSFLQKESSTMSWNFTENKTLINALLEGVINYSSSYPNILQWGSDTGMVNDNYPIHTTVKGHAHDDKGGEVYSRYPTCTEEGIVEKHCSKCDYFQTVTVPATGHSYENDPSQPKIYTKAPKCEETGLACWECTNKDLNNNGAVCGHRTEEQVVPALGHSWKSVTKAATCTDPGYTRDECENGCGQVQNQVDTPATGHNYKLKIEAATCTVPEKRIETCEKCSDVVTTTSGSALGHLWDNEQGVEKESTCVEQGGYLRTCTREKCGYSEFIGERFPIAAHKYSTEKVAPTCTEPGYTIYTCDVCSVQYRNLNLLADNNYDDYVAPKGHTYANEIVPPTCKEKGYTKHTCIDCDYSYTDAEVDATGAHQYVLDTNATILPGCLTDGVTVMVCEVCKDTVRKTVSAIGHHDWKLDTARSVPQSCTAGGYDLYQCTVCLQTEKRNVTAEGFGHDLQDNVTAPTCLDGGYTTTTCSRCDYKEITDRVPALGHDYVANVIPATTTERGYTHYACSRCDDEYDKDYVAATPDASYSVGAQTLYLSDIDELMNYSLNGGVSWEAVEVSATSVSADAINADIGIWVKRPGNDVLPLSDSAVQVITVPIAAQPDHVIGVSGDDNRPGMIVGVDKSMEYRMEGEEVWHPIDAEVLEGLAAGVYYIRVKATDTTLASKPYRVEIKGSSTPGTSDEPGITTPPGFTSGPGVTTPGGSTGEPGVTTPGGSTDKPGVTTPGGSTNKPGTTTSPANTGTRKPGTTTTPPVTTTSGGGTINGGNSGSHNQNNNGNTSGSGSNNNASGGTDNVNGVSTTTSPGVIGNNVYYSSNGGASNGNAKVTSSGYKAAKTGDDSNIAVWLLIIATAVSAVVVTRKKKVQE